jgi:hypothetical protein
MRTTLKFQLRNWNCAGQRVQWLADSRVTLRRVAPDREPGAAPGWRKVHPVVAATAALVQGPAFHSGLAVGMNFDDFGVEDLVLPASWRRTRRIGHYPFPNFTLQSGACKCLPGHACARREQDSGYQQKRIKHRRKRTASINGGGGRIRTHENLTALLVFKTSAFNHSATPPAPGAF